MMFQSVVSEVGMIQILRKLELQLVDLPLFKTGMRSKPLSGF